MLIVMDKPAHEEILIPPIQTKNIKHIITVTFPTGYNGIFRKKTKNNNFYFATSITYKDGFIERESSPAASELEILNEQSNRNIIEQGHFTEKKFPFLLKSNFWTLGSIVDISRTEPLLSFVQDDSIRDLLGFDPVIKFEKRNLSSNPVDILPFNITFLETDTAQLMIIKGKWTGVVHNFTMDVDRGYSRIKKFRDGIPQ